MLINATNPHTANNARQPSHAEKSLIFKKKLPSPPELNTGRKMNKPTIAPNFPAADEIP